jgi:hypothetical protein
MPAGFSPARGGVLGGMGPMHLLLPLLALDPHPAPWGRLHLPALTATVFVAGPRVMAARLVGAALILAAVALAMPGP